MRHAPRVLVVEDDPGIAEAVVYALERDGFATQAARTLEAARAARDSATMGAAFDLVILDLGLPDGSGFSLLGEWRKGSPPPRVIVLTSRDEEVDCVASLEAGADDFVGKPFSPRALVARARAVLRRPRTEAAPGEAEMSGLAVDTGRRLAFYAGRELALTKTEFDLLSALVAAQGRVRARRELVRCVWGEGYALTERTVDSHVKALRRKLEDAGAPATLIAAVRGVGFKIEARVES